MTEEEIKITKKHIDAMSQESMAWLQRFAPSGHPYFEKTNGDIAEYFNKSFQSKGGMTPEISKNIGWEK